jgi:hypothetical protein
MVEFHESSEELFSALPRIYELKKEMADTVLTELRRRAAGSPLDELTELWREADFREATSNWSEAITLSEQALAKCRDLHFPPYQLRVGLATLVRRRLNVTDPGQRLRADKEIEQLAEGGSDGPLADALFLRATTWLSEGNVLGSDPAELDSAQRATAVKAMADFERAAGCAVDSYQRSNIMLARTSTCRLLGRDEEGMRLTAEAIAFFRDSFPVTSLPPAQWSDRVVSLQGVYSYRVELLSRARPPRVGEIFECADDGRSQLLRHQIAWAQGGSDNDRLLDRPSYRELRALLREENAALVQFEVGSQHTSVLIVDPEQAEPGYRQIDLTRRELSGVVPAPKSGLARGRLFAALPSLSKKLVPPLSRVVDRYPVIYLVPSSDLYCVPFAGLTLDSGEYLIEHCALAHVPSASLLKWCAQHRRKPAERLFLALGAGGADGDGPGSERISFAAQAQKVTAEVGRMPGVLARLLPETTLGAEFLDQAESASIVHLECHGSLDGEADAFAESYLELADNLSAQQVAQRQNRFSAELVFLNACLSGVFGRTVPNEPGGFWQAFLLAGATSLVATLVRVEPRRASELVTGFYDEWLGRGADKAIALQSAQLKMLRSGVAPQYWATHILVGDHR